MYVNRDENVEAIGIKEVYSEDTGEECYAEKGIIRLI